MALPDHYIKRWMYGLAALIGLVLLWLVWPGPPEPIRAAEESCLDCHGQMKGFSPFHDPSAIGCASCHAGNPASAEMQEAHEGMFLVPGNLSNASEACGTLCHADLVERVRTSLMATGRGIVSVNRWVFGEQDSPDGQDGLGDLHHSPADEHLRQLCSTCHLGSEKPLPGPVSEMSRGGGCVACHIVYGAERGPDIHPRLTIDVSNDHCFGCHSRSGRISTNYEGRHETLLPAPPDDTHRVLMDGRVFERQPADVHHEAGLACIDCHTSYETMGDGTVYAHQNQATHVQCSDCHAAAPPTVTWDGLDLDARKILLIRHAAPDPERRYVTTAEKGRALVNVFLDEAGRPVLEEKRSGKRHPLAAPTEACLLPGHERVSCQSCHSAWVPQCVGCHTQRDREGTWQEFASDFHADAPVLGLFSRKPGDAPRIEPFAPGMIMTLNANRRNLAGSLERLRAEGSFHRLYAPAAPHTTAAEGRTCRSCHADPSALGVGRGVLSPGDSSAWRFDPLYAPLRDGLPGDAWTAFLADRRGPVSTRTGARPFNRTEQQRILRVGVCLECHPSGDAALYRDFNRSLARMPRVCRTSPVDGG